MESITDGHFGRAGDRIIHGQSINIESLSSVDRKLLPNDAKRVILVPWDYGPDCNPTPWTGTARWITPRTRGIYHAVLRKQSHWLNGVPVLDVYSPEYVPYAGVIRPGMRSFSGDSTMLGVDELYDAVEHLPNPAAMKLDPVAATEPFLEWARAHRSIVERAPLNDMVRMMVHTLREQRAAQLSSVLSGTFRFVVSITGQRDPEFFMRTTQTSATGWDAGHKVQSNIADDITRTIPIYGLEIRTTLATTISELPATCYQRNMKHEAWVEVALNPMTIAGGARSWSGQIGWGVANLALGKDGGLDEFKSAWIAAQATRFGPTGPLPGSRVFFGDAEGIKNVKDEIVLADGRVIGVKGERVSGVVEGCERVR